MTPDITKSMSWWSCSINASSLVRRELTEQLALRFKLTEEERQEHLPSGPQKLFYNRVAWAKTHLKNAGLINNPVRGNVSISEGPFTAEHAEDAEDGTQRNKRADH
jgi:restriction endonuclease Mrr